MRRACTTVKIYLPKLVGHATESADEALSRPLLLGEQGEIVLVVDDEAAVRQVSVEALRELGYTVLEADCGEKALLLLEAHPDVAMLFTDIVMPDMNGRKLADAARVKLPALKVLFTTGYTRNAVVHNGTLDEDVHLIGKPFTVDELAAKMRRVLEDRPDAIEGT